MISIVICGNSVIKRKNKSLEMHNVTKLVRARTVYRRLHYFKVPEDIAERLVVIGNGMAGCRAVEEILARAPGRYAITIFGAEPRVNYNRIMLSPVLAGEKAFEDIVINDAAWYADNAIELVSGDPVAQIDRATGRVITKGGKVQPYDRLLIATGSDPFIIPVPGHDLPGVVTFRDLDDVDKMLAAAEQGGSAVVIGGGLLGLEAANALSLMGLSPHVVERNPRLMPRQVDQAGGEHLARIIGELGIGITLSADTLAIEAGERSVALVFNTPSGKHGRSDGGKAQRLPSGNLHGCLLLFWVRQYVPPALYDLVKV
mgnify:CR=1 FL=1